MRFSNDGSTWSPAESYSGLKSGWDLASYGGTAEPGLKVVYAQFEDGAGNWSSLLITDGIQLQGSGAEGGGGGGIDPLLLVLLLALFLRPLKSR